MRHTDRNLRRDSYLWILSLGIGAIAVAACPHTNLICRFTQAAPPTSTPRDVKPNPVSRSDKHTKTPKPPRKQAAIYRQWTDVTGRYSVEAELVEFTGGKVTLRKRNNRVVSLVIEKLCTADRKHINDIALGDNLIVGPVVQVTDGDTLVVQGAKKKHVVSLRGIEAPKKKQDFAARAKAILSKKVLVQKVRINWSKRDKSSRIIGDVYIGDRWINREMLEDGSARHGKQIPTSKELVNAEKQARSKKTGLWSEPAAISARNPDENTTGKTNSPAKRPATDPKKKSPAGDATVYVTKSGTKYHRSGCQHVSKSKTPIPLSEARKKYSPCKQCKPPT